MAVMSALRKALVCYAFMQAVGMVNDHFVTCFRHEQLRAP